MLKLLRYAITGHITPHAAAAPLRRFELRWRVSRVTLLMPPLIGRHVITLAEPRPLRRHRQDAVTYQAAADTAGH